MSQLDSIIEQLKAEVQAAYDRGFQAGATHMREAIIKAAAIPVVRPVAHSHKEYESLVARPSGQETLASMFSSGANGLSEAITQRAARGAVSRMLERVFADFPSGLTITEIEGIAEDYDKTVALKSIGNELRRSEGDKYRRDEFNKWFLIGGNAGKKTAGTPHQQDPAVVSETERG